MKKKLIFGTVFLTLTCLNGYLWSNFKDQARLAADFERLFIEQSRKVEGLEKVNKERAGELDAYHKKLDTLLRYGGFQEFPIPAPGEEEFILILDTFGAGAVFSDDVTSPDSDQVNTKFYVAYDMRRNKFLALQDSLMGLSGRDFVIIVGNGPYGSRTFHPVKGEEATRLFERFHLKSAPDRH